MHAFRDEKLLNFVGIIIIFVRVHTHTYAFVGKSAHPYLIGLISFISYSSQSLAREEGGVGLWGGQSSREPEHGREKGKENLKNRTEDYLQRQCSLSTACRVDGRAKA